MRIIRICVASMGDQTQGISRLEGRFEISSVKLKVSENWPMTVKNIIILSYKRLTA